MLRTAFAGLTLAVATILLAPVAVAAHVLRIDEDERRVQQWCMRTWARSVCWAAGVRLHLHGAENIATQGTVYASNHVSWFDIFAIASLLPRYTFVAKEELRHIPIFGWGAEGAGVVFLSRANRKGAFAAYESVAKELEKGLNVVVCPEGTRGDSYALRPFKKGPFVLAIAGAAPIVPIVVYGAREAMPKGEWRVRPADIHVHLLPAVPTTGYTYERRNELVQIAWQRMANKLRENGVQSGPVASPAD